MTSQQQTPEPKHAATPEDDGYTPMFSARVRTVIYVLGVVCSALAIILAILSTDLGWPKWTVDLIAALGPILPGVSAAFGVHYAGISK